MSGDAFSPLQKLVQQGIDRSGKARDYFDSRLKTRLGTTGKPIWDIMRGKSKKPSSVTLSAISEELGIPIESLVAAANGEQVVLSDRIPTRSVDGGETAQLLRLDLSLPMGPGATVDDYVEEEPVEFDLGYLRAITRTPVHRLRLARGVGDSMTPTLQSNDEVLIDTTQNQLLHSDRIYAAAINGGAAIKRLRPIEGGKRILVISDNKTIDSYAVEAREVLIWGRVIRFSRDL